MLSTNKLGDLYKATCDEILPYYSPKNHNPSQISNKGYLLRAGDCIARTAVALALTEYHTDKKALAQIFYSTSVRDWRDDRFTHARAIIEGDQQKTIFIMDSNRTSFMGRVWSKTSSGLIEPSGVKREPNFLIRGKRHETLNPAEFSNEFIRRPWKDVARDVIDLASDIL